MYVLCRVYPALIPYVSRASSVPFLSYEASQNVRRGVRFLHAFFVHILCGVLLQIQPMAGFAMLCSIIYSSKLSVVHRGRHSYLETSLDRVRSRLGQSIEQVELGDARHVAQTV